MTLGPCLRAKGEINSITVYIKTLRNTFDGLERIGRTSKGLGLTATYMTRPDHDSRHPILANSTFIPYPY